MNEKQIAEALATFFAALEAAKAPASALLPGLDHVAEGAAALGVLGADIEQDSIAMKSAVLAFLNAASTLAGSVEALRSRIT